MNHERIEELQKFANDFNMRLENAHLKYEENAAEEKKRSLSASQKFPSHERKKKSFSNNIFEKQKPWMPPHVYNRYFEKFQRLKSEKDLNSWEQLRVANMLPRSYRKEKELPQGKDMKPCHGVGQEFDEHLKENEKLVELGDYGKSLIGKFKTQFENRENLLKNHEAKLWEVKHSKPPIQWNPWKPANHVKEEFIVFPADDIHSFRVEKKKPFLIEEPFRIPKKDGTYFFDRAGVNIHKY